jgi:hypothetical protein
MTNGAAPPLANADLPGGMIERCRVQPADVVARNGKSELD